MTGKTDNEQLKIQSASDDEFQTIEIKNNLWSVWRKMHKLTSDEKTQYDARLWFLNKIEEEKEDILKVLVALEDIAINGSYIKKQNPADYSEECMYLKQFIKEREDFVLLRKNLRGEFEEKKIKINKIPYLINGNDFQRLFLEVAKKMKWGEDAELNNWYFHTYGVNENLYLGFIQPIDIAKELIIHRECTILFSKYNKNVQPVNTPTLKMQRFSNTFDCIDKRIKYAKTRDEVKQKLLDVLQTLQSNKIFNADYSINGEKINEYITNKSETIQGQIKGVLVPFILNKAGLENQTKKAGKNSYLYGVLKAIEQDTNIKDIGKAISNKISPVTNKFSQALEDFCK